MKFKKTIFTFSFLIGIYFSFCAILGHSAEESFDDIFDSETELYVDEMRSFSASTPKRVLVGNPNIVDVVDVTTEAVMLMPKSIGSTTFIFWDSLGEHSHRLRVMSENMEDLKARIDALLDALDIPGVSTKIAKGENKVFILGEVRTLDEKERIITALGDSAAKTINLIKVKEENRVVDIDVQVLELSEGAGKTLGLTWPTSATLTETTTGTTAVGTSNTGTTKWGGLFRVLNLVRSPVFSLKLDALIEEGKAHVLSRPRLACQSGKEAELLVGGEKPIFTTSSASATTGSSTSVSYKEYGIKLKIKPQVTEEERLKLAVNMEITELEALESIGTTTSTEATTTATAYPVTKRSAVTELFLNSGQTLTIGGLIKQKKSETVTMTPLGKVPVLGALFRKRATNSGGGASEQGNRELFILLTPTIIKEEPVPSLKKKSTGPADAEQAVLSVKDKDIALIEPADPVTAYAENVKDMILGNLTYSSLAKDAGDEGTVTLSLQISSTGKLLDAVIKKSSGSPALDTNTLFIARGISYYPPFSSSIRQSELRLEIPIVYKLD